MLKGHVMRPTSSCLYHSYTALYILEIGLNVLYATGCNLDYNAKLDHFALYLYPTSLCKYFTCGTNS